MTYSAYNGARAILEFNPAQTNLQSAIVGKTLYGMGIDEIIARNNNGTGQWFIQDRLGSTRAVLNAAGEVIEQYRYDAFGTPEFHGPPTTANPQGAVLSQTAINNRFLFTGREWVQRYGFYDYRARAYHPRLGRFMSEDPLGFAAGDTNLFRYCGGDPVNWTDPSGLVENWRLGFQNEALQGHVGQGLSSQGFWSGPNGLPTGLGGGGVDGTNQGGGRGDGGYTLGWVEGIIVSDVLNTFNNGTNPGFTGLSNGLGTFGFSLGEISTRMSRHWEPLYRFLDTPPTPEQIAWTATGRNPTIAAALILSAPLWAPASGLVALEALTGFGSAVVTTATPAAMAIERAGVTVLAGAYVGGQALLANQVWINRINQVAGGLTPSYPSTPYEAGGFFISWWKTWYDGEWP